MGLKSRRIRVASNYSLKNYILGVGNYLRSAGAKLFQILNTMLIDKTF